MVSTSRRFGTPKLALSLVASAALLAACGGGGGDSSSASTNAAPQAVTVSGVAAKGLMRNALVQAYAVTAGGQKGAAIGSPVRTSPVDGTYTLSGLPTDAVILLEVVADSQTTLLDEATGQSIVPTAGFALRAAVKAAAGGTTSAHITPYSELAVTQALKLSSGLSTANIEASNAAVVKLAGFNPLTDTPKFDANGKPLNESGAKLAALSLLAKNDAGCPGSQADKISCEVAALKAKLNTPDSLSTTIASAIDAAKTNWPDADIKIAAGTYTPPTDSTAPVTGVSLAKAFFGNLRSNARAIDDTTPGANSLVNEWKKLSDSVGTHLLPDNVSALVEVNLVTNALGYYIDVVKDQTSSFEPTRVYDLDGRSSICGLYQDSDEKLFATNAGNAKYAICRSTEVWGMGSSSWSTSGSWSWSQTSFGHRVVLSAAAAANTYNVKTRLLKTISTATSTTYGSTDVSVSPGGAIDFDATVVAVNNTTAGQLALSIKGDLAPVVNNALVVAGDRNTVDLQVTTRAIDSTLNEIAVTGDLSVIRWGALDSSLRLLSGTYGRFESLGGNELDSPTIKGSRTEVSVKVEGWTPGGKVNGTLLATGFTQDKSGNRYLPSSVTFTGSLGGSAANATPLFEGSFSLLSPNLSAVDLSASDESATNYIKAIGTLQGTFHVPTQADIKLSLTADATKWADGAHQASLSGLYQQKDVSVTLSSQFPLTGGSDPTFTLKSANDLTLTYVPGQTILPLLKNGVEVARLDTKKLRIDYVDGTFERF